MHFAEILLIVSQHPEGCTYEFLEDQLGLTNSSVSRSVMAMGPVDRKGYPGYKLLKIKKDPLEGRRNLVMLSRRGKKLVNDLKDI